MMKSSQMTSEIMLDAFIDIVTHFFILEKWFNCNYCPLFGNYLIYSSNLIKETIKVQVIENPVELSLVKIQKYYFVDTIILEEFLAYKKFEGKI